LTGIKDAHMANAKDGALVVHQIGDCSRSAHERPVPDRECVIHRKGVRDISPKRFIAPLPSIPAFKIESSHPHR
jgi:hypothetical protein